MCLSIIPLCSQLFSECISYLSVSYLYPFNNFGPKCLGLPTRWENRETGCKPLPTGQTGNDWAGIQQCTIYGSNDDDDVGLLRELYHI